MPTPSIRVLVVEDYAGFRRFLVSRVQGRAELQVICEVADGAEAVQKAREFQPELILLDIGLPSLNGIEAARQIRKLSPLSKILFVETNPIPVKTALALMGKIKPVFRMPLCEMKKENQEKLKQVLKKMGVLA